jgi:hypothetical protein
MPSLERHLGGQAELLRVNSGYCGTSNPRRRPLGRSDNWRRPVASRRVRYERKGCLVVLLSGIKRAAGKPSSSGFMGRLPSGVPLCNIKDLGNYLAT